MSGKDKGLVIYDRPMHKHNAFFNSIDVIKTFWVEFRQLKVVTSINIVGTS